MADAQQIIDLAERHMVDAEPCSYSGRAMYGRRCLGFRAEDEGPIWQLALALGQEGVEIPAPSTDSMGRGIIFYWPDIEYQGDDEEDDE